MNENPEKRARTLVEQRLLRNTDEAEVDFSDDRAHKALELLNQGHFSSQLEEYIHDRSLTLSRNPGFSALLSLNNVKNIIPFEYQIDTVKRVLQEMRGRALLCDEVGLGKTIEAGLIMLEYILRGLVRKVLILCPPSLVTQWREEMRTKFNLDFVVYNEPPFSNTPDPWNRFDHVIGSINRLKLQHHRQQVEKIPFDMVIVDEAHKCRNRETLNWKFVSILQKKYILLLTATPVQNDLSELFNLITLLRPGQLETARSFSHKFITRGDRMKPKNVDELRALTHEVMVRNRRESSGVPLPRRHAETVNVHLSLTEKAFYTSLSQFVRERYVENANGSTGLILKTLQKEAGSSHLAALQTVRKLTESDALPGSRDELEELIHLADSISGSAKVDALLKLIEASNEKLLLFTQYHATLQMLADELQAAGVGFTVFHGGKSRGEKDEAVRRFAEDSGIQVLLSTESGGEGRNLQFCHVMVNYDLPWNPMKIEQRIGRIHRIGQENDVYIFNLAASETIESHIIKILDTKINMFELVVGELDMILGNVEDDRDFEDIIMEIWSSSPAESDLTMRMDELGDILAKAKAQYDRVKDYDDRLFGESV